MPGRIANFDVFGPHVVRSHTWPTTHMDAQTFGLIAQRTTCPWVAFATPNHTR